MDNLKSHDHQKLPFIKAVYRAVKKIALLSILVDQFFQTADVQWKLVKKVSYNFN